jgi:membrane glycosyltransferase
MTPPVVVRANVMAAERSRLDAEIPKGLYLLHSDPQFRAFHAACLPRPQKRRNGNIPAEWALADAKLSDAETIDEAMSWLHPKERMAILQDQTLIAHLALLPKVQPSAEAASPAG